MAIPPMDSTQTVGRRSRPQVAPAQSTSGQAHALAERLAREMAAAWRQGGRPPAEEYLARHPELGACPEAALRLAYEEICLRQEVGQSVSSVEVLRRFPQWRDELRVLLDCHRLVQPCPAAPLFPGEGETLGDFHLVAELDRGARGQVFLATQPYLADRPVVLKVTPCDGQEHQSLARLQHTHIVPLYSVQDWPDRNLRALCMPYLGGVTLARLLAALQEQPPEQRTGQDLLDALDQAQAAAPVAQLPRGPARKFLARASYVQAVCWVGTCLADALHYAHERGLVHLDLKPSNVLLAADGQPMLLDFHLAREPVRPGGPAPEWLGGTPAYMSPEQRAALAAVREGRPVPAAVDGRSDVYSLGLLLYEALGGTVPHPSEAPPAPLHRLNPHVSPGLAALVGKCLAADPRDRYPDAAALAADLRRHLNDLPLRGVANRSLAERWRKWRRRRPHALALAGMLLAVLGVVGAAGTVTFAYVNQQRAHGGHRLHEAEKALADGQQRLQNREHAEAVRTLTRGLALTEGIPGADDLRRNLDGQLRQARRAQAADDLHGLVDRLRFLYGLEFPPPGGGQELERRCRAVWDARDRITDRSGGELGPEVEQRIQADLLDLAILWADLRVRLAPADEAAAARREALQVLAEAEALFGPSHLLFRERQAHAEALGLTDVARRAAERASELAPRTAWEHSAVGRFLLRSGELAPAARALERSLELQPQGFWPNFYQGTCAYRLRRYEDALNAFCVCVALAPERAECFHNRALAHAALGHTDCALHDYGRALELDPGLAAAALNRGTLHYREKRYADATADLRRALDNGADPAVVHYNLALVHLSQKDRAAALASLQRALQDNPGHKDARALYDRLRRER